MTDHRERSEEDWENDKDWDDGEDESEEPLIRCPYCHAEMLEIAWQCPECGQAVSREDQPASRRHPLVILVVACLLAVFLWSAFR